MSPITQHYVFGYGSLICSQSRAISAPTLATRTALPVRIQNVVRTWNKRSAKSGATYLGVQQIDDSIVQTNKKNKKHNDGCVGVLIPMDTTSTENAQEELEALDDREIGYDRQYVPLEWIHRVDDLLNDSNGYDGDLYKGTFLDSSSNMTTAAIQNTAVWMYVPQISQPATLEYPIVQSYVDICLRGCLSISESFLHEFITSTIGWNPQDLVDLESIMMMSSQQQDNDSDDDNNMDDDTSSEAASSQGWHHRSSSSLSSYPSYMMRGSHNRNNSEFSSLSSFMDLDNDDDDDQVVGDTATTDDSRDVPKSIATTPDAWVNDRKDPLYMRADRTFSLENAKVIDELIMSTMTSSAATTKKQQRSHRLHGGGSSNIMAKQKSLWNTLRVTRGKKELNNIRKRNQFFTGIKSQ